MTNTANDLYSKIFWQSVQKRQENGERYGQAVFNSAHGLFPDEAGSMVATELDPFYNDSLVKKFLDELSSRIGG